VGFGVRQVGSGMGRRLLIQPTSEDSKIQFHPADGTGLSRPAAARIAAEVRKLVRRSFQLLPVDLPAEFPFTEFKGVGSGDGGAIALPLQLSGAAPPPGGLQAITGTFVGASGFAFAVSSDYARSLIDVEAIREGITRLSYSTGWTTYHFRFTSGPTLTFRSGLIEVSGRIEAEASWAPDVTISFKVAITLLLDGPTQLVSLQRVGEPDVDVEYIPDSWVQGEVRTEVDKALAANTPSVQRVFRDARQKLVDGLRRFEETASATYAGIEISPDGITVRGEIGSGTPRPAPVVEIAETPDGAAFTGLRSWIPGGRLDRLVWSWVDHSSPIPSPWAGVTMFAEEAHRFVFPKPVGLTDLSQVCLRVEGAQILPGGQTVPVAGGTTCRVPEPTIVLDMPSWWEPVTVPMWRPDVPDGAILREAMVGHVTVQGDPGSRDVLTQNHLVYFLDRRADRPLRALASVLSSMRRRVALGLLVVVPPGTFDGRRREVEAELGSLGEGPLGGVHVTEDDEGGWTRTFAPSRLPATYLVDARRRFAWRHEGDLEPHILAAALDRHVVPAPVPRRRPLRLAISRGQRAPDAIFRDDNDRQLALHRARGSQIILAFWQSWSAPCLRELARLQAARGRGVGTALVVAFHGGKDEGALGDVRRRLGLTFVLAHDAHQRVARAFGIRCWPTTVRLDSEGRVEHVRFGFSPDRSADADRVV
jgi:peroxiredoxin